MVNVVLSINYGRRPNWFNEDDLYPYCNFCESLDKPFIEISPDILRGFTPLPFHQKKFKLVVFSPPHLIRTRGASLRTIWAVFKHGKLDKNWKQTLYDGFQECMRVLDDYGTLIFKWNEVQIPIEVVLEAIQAQPLFSNQCRRDGVHWLVFVKIPGKDAQGQKCREKEKENKNGNEKI